MALTREVIEQKLSDIETELLVPGQGTCVSWMGIDVSWEPGTKRNGCMLKRGNTYGRIKYRNYSRSIHPDPAIREDDELTREQAIAYAMKPRDLREMDVDLAYIWGCSICGATVIGQEAYRKGRHLLHKGKDIDICESCLDAITEGQIKAENR